MAARQLDWTHLVGHPPSATLHKNERGGTGRNSASQPASAGGCDCRRRMTHLGCPASGCPRSPPRTRPLPTRLRCRAPASASPPDSSPAGALPPARPGRDQASPARGALLQNKTPRRRAKPPAIGRAAAAVGGAGGGPIVAAADSATPSPFELQPATKRPLAQRIDPASAS